MYIACGGKNIKNMDKLSQQLGQYVPCNDVVRQIFVGFNPNNYDFLPFPKFHVIELIIGTPVGISLQLHVTCIFLLTVSQLNNSWFLGRCPI